jgi:hypothetical protein
VAVKLGGFADGRLFASAYRSVLREDERGAFERVGRLPAPAFGRDGIDYRLRTTRGWKSVVERFSGRFPSMNLFPVSETELVATTSNRAFSSGDGGATWTVSARLPESSGAIGVLPSGVCVADGAVYLGEYPLDDEATPRIRVSYDGGRSWETHVSLPSVRHVHSVQEDPYTGDLWVTTGDRDEECTVGRLVDGRLEAVGGGSQRWRAVELAFTPTGVLWGMDCVYADENEILRLDRDEFDARSPSPTVVHTTSNSVYFAAGFDVDDTRWVALSTAVGTGGDSTAPGDDVRGTEDAVVLTASAETDFTDWHRLATYRRRRGLNERLGLSGRLPTANAYVYLDASDRGLFLNPFNTTTDDGKLRRVAPDRFRSLGD